MRSIQFVFFFLITCLSANAQTAAAGFDHSPADAGALRMEAFNKVWQTVNDNHYDPTFGGVDWPGVRAKYLPQVQAAVSNDELHSILRRMLGELRLSHFGIYPNAPQTPTSERGAVGVDLRIIGNKAVIFRVEAGSPAEAAGLKPGFVIERIDEKNSRELLKPLEDSFKGRNLTAGMMNTYRERTLEAMLSGAPGSAVSVTLRDAKDKRKEAVMTRKAFSGEMSQPLGNFPAQEVIFESRMLPENIGYIRFNIWVIAQMPKIRAAIQSFAGAKGIIFDIRGNPGGVGGMAPGVAGMLADKRFSLGSMQSRSGKMEFLAYPQPEPFSGPIAVLTDGGSASTSEVFAVGLQEAGRAKVAGATTAGAVLPSVFVTLPTEALFQYAVADYRSPSNILIEGRGVAPDIAVELDRASLLAGRDLQLEAAVNYILK